MSVFTGQTHTLVAQKGRRAGLLIPMLWKEIKLGGGGACGTTKKEVMGEKNTLGGKERKTSSELVLKVPLAIQQKT